MNKIGQGHWTTCFEEPAGARTGFAGSFLEEPAGVVLRTTDPVKAALSAFTASRGGSLWLPVLTPIVAPTESQQKPASGLGPERASPVLQQQSQQGLGFPLPANTRKRVGVASWFAAERLFPVLPGTKAHQQAVELIKSTPLGPQTPATLRFCVALSLIPYKAKEELTAFIDFACLGLGLDLCWDTAPENFSVNKKGHLIFRDIFFTNT